ncbi:hypothetical protein BAUCODRAFT_385398 [Baudoinia panamericana UAMH 10762]|uniref:Uncharacterized protein n=1 Tax=Baudoinia panamericana (strain UAMH 10762) TaxID=717646 RepID=M2NHU7_BAUPA|nr:uncharacterized protein BAUCODRAFT_385398 [Baudoinia panamericana UAMH 10762]EMC98929.1 hypothetical protein BAUCODRAFT_385398 [Baudoinia panamericana UAMH 10762]
MRGEPHTHTTLHSTEVFARVTRRSEENCVQTVDTWLCRYTPSLVQTPRDALYGSGLTRVNLITAVVLVCTNWNRSW